MEMPLDTQPPLDTPPKRQREEEEDDAPKSRRLEEEGTKEEEQERCFFRLPPFDPASKVTPQRVGVRRSKKQQDTPTAIANPAFAGATYLHPTYKVLRTQAQVTARVSMGKVLREYPVLVQSCRLFETPSPKYKVVLVLTADHKDFVQWIQDYENAMRVYVVENSSRLLAGTELSYKEWDARYTRILTPTDEEDCYTMVVTMYPNDRVRPAQFKGDLYQFNGDTFVNTDTECERLVNFYTKKGTFQQGDALVLCNINMMRLLVSNTYILTALGFDTAVAKRSEMGDMLP